MRLTASALHRADRCLGSCVLPGISESGEYADTGNAIDRYVQQAKTGDPAKALAAAPADLRPYLTALPLAKIPDGAEYQVAFAWSALTGEVRRISSRQDGYPDMGPEWVFGSSDIVGVRDGRLFLLDLKWGSYTIGRDPETDLQLGFLSMCGCKLAGVAESETGFLRADWRGDLHYDMATLDEWTLAGVEARVGRLWLRQQQATGHASNIALHVGEHCTYCPARRVCPAMAQPVALALSGRVAELAAETLPTLEQATERIHALSLVDKGRLYERLDAADKYLGMLRGILRDDARTEPLPLSDGKELREVQWGSRKASEAHKAREAALEAEGRASGEVQTVKVAQVRPMKAR